MTPTTKYPWRIEAGFLHCHILCGDRSDLAMGVEGKSFFLPAALDISQVRLWKAGISDDPDFPNGLVAYFKELENSIYCAVDYNEFMVAFMAPHTIATWPVRGGMQ
jgi:hypothetical protein